MGQRFQVFIHCLNPVISLKKELEVIQKYSVEKKKIKHLSSEVKRYTKAFGCNDYTTIAYHHQWLFGRSAVHAASRIVAFNQFTKAEANPLKSVTPINGEELLQFQRHLLSLFNSKLAQLIGRFGLEKFQILNFNQPDIRHDCTSVDNNDGIVVIDCIDDRYCFLNVGTGDTTISQIPVLEPCSAEQYISLYYPTEISQGKTSNVPDTNIEQLQYFNTNRRVNRLFLKPFKNYELMSRSDLEKMFPDSFVKVGKSTAEFQ
jgi:hypothetical protein